MTDDSRQLPEGRARPASEGASTFISTDGQLIAERKPSTTNGLENPPVAGASNLEASRQDPSFAFNTAPDVEAGKFVPGQ